MKACSLPIESSRADAVTSELVRVIAQRSRSKRRAAPLIVGLCGSQGSGKSTLAAVLRAELKGMGVTVATLSLDDVYLPLHTRIELANTIHPLLRTRGVPGTHDISLATEVIDSLRRSGTTLLPVFDKATDDRRPQTEWISVPSRVEVLIFEGWCVGAVPESEQALAEPINVLEREEDASGVWRGHVNRTLRDFYQPLFGQLDLLILLAAPSFEVVYRWRLEQEIGLRRAVAERGGDAARLMTDAQLARFISHYERLTRHILREMPGRAHIVVRLDSARHKRIERLALPNS